MFGLFKKKKKLIEWSDLAFTFLTTTEEVLIKSKEINKELILNKLQKYLDFSNQYVSDDQVDHINLALTISERDPQIKELYLKLNKKVISATESKKHQQEVEAVYKELLAIYSSYGAAFATLLSQEELINKMRNS